MFIIDKNDDSTNKIAFTYYIVKYGTLVIHILHYNKQEKVNKTFSRISPHHDHILLFNIQNFHT